MAGKAALMAGNNRTEDELYSLAKEVREAYRRERPPPCGKPPQNGCMASCEAPEACLKEARCLQLVDFLLDIVGQASRDAKIRPLQVDLVSLPKLDRIVNT